MNKNYQGIGYWLIGFALLGLGYVLMPNFTFKSLEKFTVIGNPILVLGHLFLYIGVREFFNKRLNLWVPLSIFALFNFAYYYFMLINNNVLLRTLSLTLTLVIISFMITYQLLSNKDKRLYPSSTFTGLVFIIYGLYFFLYILDITLPQGLELFVSHRNIFKGGLIVSILASTLWTFGFIIMLNQRLNIENQMEKEKFHSIFKTNVESQLITRFKDGLIVDANYGFLIISGYSRYEVVGKFIKDINIWSSPEDRSIFTNELNEKGIVENMEFVFRRKDNTKFNGLLSARIITIDSQPHIISVARDISQIKKKESMIRESEEKYRSIINGTPINVIITDLTGRILLISPSANEMFGYEKDFDGFLGMEILDFLVEDDFKRATSNILNLYKDDSEKVYEYKALKKDNTTFDIEITSELMYTNDHIPEKIVFIIRDITEYKQSEEKIQNLIQQLEIEKTKAELNSNTDSLTGLANRRYFDEVLGTEFSRLRRSGSRLSLIMLDIDYFKKYNDTYGHLAGDSCLREIAAKLKTIINRGSDVVARFGGEEFIVILPETDEIGAQKLGEIIRKAIENMCIPHTNSDISHCVTVSVGIVTLYPDKSNSPDSALKMVDEALYTAKNQGRNRCSYRSGFNQDTPIVE